MLVMLVISMVTFLLLISLAAKASADSLMLTVKKRKSLSGKLSLKAV